MPKFELEDVEDFYTYYVQILGITEACFWDAPLSFVLSVAENKAAYDSYITYQIKRLREDG